MRSLAVGRQTVVCVRGRSAEAKQPMPRLITEKCGYFSVYPDAAGNAAFNGLLTFGIGLNKLSMAVKPSSFTILLC